MSNSNATVLVRVWAGLLLIFTPAPAAAQTVGCEQVLTLADLERMALQANPTSAQAQAAIRAAEGRRVQAGLWPNPVVGYTGEEFSTRAFNEKSEHFAFIEQTILLGGKLGKSRRIFAQEKVLAEQEALAQRYRVLNTVRILFYEALGAQRRVETRAELVRIAREAVGVTEQLFNVGQADRPDTYEIEIEAQRAQLDLIMAENRQDQVWQQLGAVLGDPFLKRIEPCDFAGQGAQLGTQRRVGFPHQRLGPQPLDRRRVGSVGIARRTSDAMQDSAEQSSLIATAFGQAAASRVGVAGEQVDVMSDCSECPLAFLCPARRGDRFPTRGGKLFLGGKRLGGPFRSGGRRLRNCRNRRVCWLRRARPGQSRHSCPIRRLQHPG